MVVEFDMIRFRRVVFEWSKLLKREIVMRVLEIGDEIADE